MKLSNPFAVQTPEGMSAEAIVALFVDVFTDFYNVPHQGHTFLHGPRGSGKSMMFRYLEPDCQVLAGGCSFTELPFFAVYVPIKATEMRLAELRRLRKTHAEHIVNEHLLVLYCSIRLITALDKAAPNGVSTTHHDEFASLYRKRIQKLMLHAGWDYDSVVLTDNTRNDEVLGLLLEKLEAALNQLTHYLRSLAFSPDPIPYAGPLCGYLDFLLPLAQSIRTLNSTPNGPIYLLIDDADNLSLSQTRVLNSWVACRTIADVSLKISTQLNYKTYLTVNKQPVRAPHDFSEVNISDVYTSNRSQYSKRVEAIVLRRLQAADISRNPSEFFPVYEKQENAIAAISRQLEAQWEIKGRGFRPRDDVSRYARPTYIRNLSGSKKAGSKYRYAGFQQLIDVSSGVIRYFLEAASLMFSEMRSKSTTAAVIFIDTAVQDGVVRRQAEEFLLSQVEPTLDRGHATDGSLTDLQKLNNLVRALGGTFFQLLVSDASERRVFSIALSDEPDNEVRRVLKLGVGSGFFHESMIGNKEGTGRTRLYILSRRLAPFFKLDPTSFAGYKFLTNEKVREALYNPKRFVARVKSAGADSVLEDPQIAMFEGGKE